MGYALAVVLGSPWWVYRMIRHGRYRENLSQRLGAAPIRYGLQPVIWVHGVSLGEVNAARTLVEQLHEQLPDFRVVVSSTTDTGMAAARRLFAPDHVVFRWPMDFSPAVGRALGRLRPALVVLMEGEIWPNFLAACNRRSIPAVVVNGRISPDKGYRRYKLLGGLAGKLFNRLAAIGVQDEQYAERFRSLGADPKKVCVTGMMKFDAVTVADELPGQEALAAALGIGAEEPLLVAGGTGPGEEPILLEVFARLKARHPALRLAIVPRKPERFDEVARLIESAGHRAGPPQRPAGRRDHADATGGRDPRRHDGRAAEVLRPGRVRVRGAEPGAHGRLGHDRVGRAGQGPRPSARTRSTSPRPTSSPATAARRVADAAELEAVLDQWLSDADAAEAAGAPPRPTSAANRAPRAATWR